MEKRAKWMFAVWLGACAVLMGACPELDTDAVMYTVTVINSDNGHVSADRQTARAGEIITLSVKADKGYKTASVRVSTESAPDTGDITVGGIANSRTFTMPEADVIITAAFVPADLPQHDITINETEGGTVNVNPEDSQYEEYPVIVAAEPDTGKKYHPGSLHVRGKRSGKKIKTDHAEDCDNEWSFLMPDEDVEIDASFIDDDVALYDIIIAQTADGSIECGQVSAAAGDTVIVLLVPDDADFRYREGSLAITPEIDLQNEDGYWTFIMPECPVSIRAEFEEIPRYAVNTDAGEYGMIEIEPSGRVRAGAELTITLSIIDPDNYRYVPDSFSARIADTGIPLDFETAVGDLRWKLTVPDEDAAGDMIVSALVEEIPAWAVAIPDWGDAAMVSVSPTIGRNSIREGRLVNMEIIINDPDNYRYVYNSVSVVTDTGDPVGVDSDGEFRWTFTMPASDITIDVAVEFIPYYEIKVAPTEVGGSVTLRGIQTSGSYAGGARAGSIITINAIPHAGYRVVSARPFTIPQDAVSFTKVEGQSAWTFEMADMDIELGVDFAEWGPIYKGAIASGIWLGPLTDDDKYYPDCIDLESEEPGYNGNQRAIKISSALNANGNGVQQSFGLFSDVEFDLDGVCALSFWAKANKSLNIRYVGFGDADPDKRVVYAGENNNQSIPLTTEWKRFIVPVPVVIPGNAQSATRVFLFGASIAAGNYVLIDEIEFIQSGVSVTGIEIPNTNDGIFYGATNMDTILKGVPIKMSYTADDGTTVTLQSSTNNHAIKYNLASWLVPYITVNGNVAFHNGIITPLADNSPLTLRVSGYGVTGNTMSATIFDGLLLDDFEDLENTTNVTIPGTPAAGTGYLWHTNCGSPAVVPRDFITAAHNEIHGGQAAGSWRPTATANKPRGGRNFEEKDASGYTTLAFWIKVTTGGNVNIQKNTVFTFELRNGGTLTNKTNGVFFTQQFTYDPDNADGWQEVTMPLSDFIAEGLDITAISGYAFGVVDNQGAALRIMFDDIGIRRE